MHNQEWEQLLERYYEGETTLEEERYIRTTLLKAEDNQSVEGKLAAYYQRESGKTLPLSTTARIRQRIVGKTAKQRKLRSWLSVAAALLLVLSFWFMQPKLASVTEGEPEVAAPDWSKYEVEDPEVAAAIIMQSLHSVSNNFKAGKTAMQGITNAVSLREPLD